MLNQTRMWELKKNALRKELERFDHKSPVLTVLGIHDYGDEVRTVVRFDTETLVKQGPKVERVGPVEAGIRYHERFLSEAPIPWEIVTILTPTFVHHPNVNIAGALCLGHPQAALPMGEILHRTWAAITFNLKLVNTVEWEGFNPRAAAFVRANPQLFPLTDRGLFEAKPEEKKP